MVLLDSVVAQVADGSLIVGRGIPDAWLTPGRSISVKNFPTTDGRRIDLTITARDHSVRLALAGSTGPVLFELPLFVGNIAASDAGTVDQPTGTVRLSARDHSVSVQVRRAPR